MGFLNRFSKENEPEEEFERNGGVLAVWGSPGSGKTTVSIKLAEHLSKKGNNVLLIFNDMISPPIPYVVAPSDLIGEKSLGSILAAATITEDLIKRNCVFYRKNKYLSIVGMQKGENVYTYPPFDEKLATQFLFEAEQVAPFVIIDCTSDLTSDLLSKAALMNADAVIRLMNCDLKSISYLSSQLPLLTDEKWDVDKQIKVASNVKPNEAAGSIESVLGKVSYQIPNCAEIEGQFLEGELIREMNLKSSRPFRAEIERISKEVFGI